MFIRVWAHFGLLWQGIRLGTPHEIADFRFASGVVTRLVEGGVRHPAPTLRGWKL